MKTVAFVLLLAVLGGILAGCEGDQVVNAPRKRPEGMGMPGASGAANNGANAPTANQGN